MRIGFIEKMAAQTMASKGVNRNAALARHALLWSIFAGACWAVWAFAPIEGVMISRRSSEAPLDFILVASSGLFLLLALACWMSRD